MKKEKAIEILNESIRVLNLALDDGIHRDKKELNFYKDTLEASEMAIAALSNDWVSVEMPPKEECECWVCHEANPKYPAEIACWFPEKGYFLSGNGIVLRVTHYMVIERPQPPQEKV